MAIPKMLWERMCLAPWLKLCQSITYPTDIHLLQTHLGWVLDAASRIFSVLSHPKTVDNTDQLELAPRPHQALARALKQMVEYGIPRGALSLTQLKGIGPKRAQNLVAKGIMIPTDLLNADRRELGRLLRMRPHSIEALMKNASSIENPTNSSSPNSTPPLPQHR